jgi:hypothetical protein
MNTSSESAADGSAKKYERVRKRVPIDRWRLSLTGATHGAVALLLVSFVTGQFTAGRHEILTHLGETAKWEPWRGRWWRRLAPR